MRLDLNSPELELELKCPELELDWNWNLFGVVELELESKITELESNWKNGIDPNPVPRHLLLLKFSLMKDKNTNGLVMQGTRASAAMVQWSRKAFGPSDIADDFARHIVWSSEKLFVNT